MWRRSWKNRTRIKIERQSYKEVDEDGETGDEKVEDADNEIKGDEVVKADVVEWEAMEVDEKVHEKTAWAGESLKRSEAFEMGTFRQEQEEISHAEGNEAIEEDRGLKETAEKTQDGQPVQGGEVLEVGAQYAVDKKMKLVTWKEK